MKNTKNAALALGVIATLGTSCKKELPALQNNVSIKKVGLQTNAIPKKAVAPDIFQVVKDDSRFKTHGTPKLVMQNTPKGTQQLVIIMEVNDTPAPKVLWIATASTVEQIDEQGFGMPLTQVANGMVKNIVPYFKANSTSTRTFPTEVFALSRPLSEAEIAKLKNMNRADFKQYVNEQRTESLLLGSAEAVKTKNLKGSQEVDEALKTIINDIKKKDKSIKDAEIALQKAKEDHKDGSATGNMVNKKKARVSQLQEELKVLENELAKKDKANQKAKN